MRTKIALLLTVMGLLTACSAESAEIELGGTRATATASPRMVERPWGTVKAFPTMQKAESPSAADITFAQEMIVHHRQAIDLSENVLGHEGLDDRVSASARFITQDQKNEITTMKAWLQAWNQPVESGHDHADMPGMLTPERVREIAELEMPRAQTAFLEAMIEHHEGAVSMSQDYLPDQANGFTRSTATHIISEQSIEIDFMTNLVAEFGR